MPQFLLTKERQIPLQSSSGDIANATATATLAPPAGTTAFLSGFGVTSGGATAGGSQNVTITGVVGGTMTYTYAFAVLAAAQPPLVVEFKHPLAATGPNVSIVVSMGALGAGNAHAAVNAHGYASI
jgi:hypothetical protein